MLIGDACEENPDTLAIAARKLSLPVFLFLEGDDPEAAKVFASIARLTNGAHCRFDRGSAKQLAGLLGAVAAFAVSGQAALRKTRAGVLLLKQLKS